MKNIDTSNKHCYIKYNSQPPKMVCEICDGEEVLSLPKSISDLTKELDQFEENHKQCRRST